MRDYSVLFFMIKLHMTDIIILYYFIFITGMNYSREINGDNIEFFVANHREAINVLCELILLNDNSINTENAHLS